MIEKKLDDVRQSHVNSDLSKRALKAQKIERLLELSPDSYVLRVLEIGTGAGGIAYYFGTHESGRYQVDAVDVVDKRCVTSGYRFAIVSGTDLPFDAATFDVVISNHVIEHVGGEVEQSNHLGELLRVLKPTGVGYLAVPNRWMIVEPHYNIAFLSWLPKSWRTFYLRVRRKGRYYDCVPLERYDLERLLEGAGCSYTNLNEKAIRLVFEIEHPDSLQTKLFKWLPDAALRSVRSIVPTLIYRLSH